MQKILVTDSHCYMTKEFSFIPIGKAASTHLVTGLQHTHEYCKIVQKHQISSDRPVFAVVRHPIERLKSAYIFMKYVRPQYVEKRVFPTTSSFQEMIKEVLDTEDTQLDKHIRSQVELLSRDGSWLPTQVWKMENGLDGIKRAMKIIRYKGHENHSPAVDDKCFLHHATRNKLVDRYEKDFDKFEYEKDIDDVPTTGK